MFTITSGGDCGFDADACHTTSGRDAYSSRVRWAHVCCWDGRARSRGGEGVDETLRRTSLDEKVGQLLVSSMESTFTSTDSDVFDGLASLVRDHHVGGFHLYGGMDPVPGVLLNPTYGL
jgi:hypothetical protein